MQKQVHERGGTCTCVHMRTRVLDTESQGHEGPLPVALPTSQVAIEAAFASCSAAHLQDYRLPHTNLPDHLPDHLQSQGRMRNGEVQLQQTLPKL